MPKRREKKGVYYADYLCLGKLLGAQNPRSTAIGKPAHDEMLFIIVHQAYELWFKQILHELDAVIADFGAPLVDEKRVGVAVSRLNRVGEIQKVLIEQLRILETMTPLDFLEFRDLLTPASGFQSVQFRLIEHKLGLEDARRILFDSTPYTKRLSPAHQKLIATEQKKPTLFEVVERWLERTPFVNFGEFDFWELYGSSVKAMLNKEEGIIRSNATLTRGQKKRQIESHGRTRASFASLLNATRFERLRKTGEWRMSHKATRSALLIQLYRDQPILHLPFRLLSALVDIDENFAIWRTRHAIMVHRMIGKRIGTGGSSGHHYLSRTADRYRVFSDLFNLSTFLIPRSSLPRLPEALARELGFYHDLG